MIEPKLNYLDQCAMKVVPFAEPRVETVDDVERLVNRILEVDILFRRGVLNQRNPLPSLRMTMHRAGMVYYLYTNPQTNRSALLFGRKEYVKTPEQFVTWIENHESIREKIQAHTS